MAKWMPKPIRNFIFRAYALVIMAVVVWAGYAAVTYLYKAVFRPGKSPEALLAWEATTRAEALRAPEALGITTPALRSPIAHYHAVDRWFHPDLRNGCITSGCHDPIPHSKSKELRAFANLHSTFMSCEVCHTEHATAPLPAVWTDLSSGAVQPPPTVLQLAGKLTAATQPADLTDQSAPIVSLLRQSLDVMGWDPVLDYLALQIETSQPGSPVWRQAMEQLRTEMPSHARGEYGAKITPASADGRPARRDLSALLERYFSRKADQADRGVILKQVHEGVVEKPEGCLPCHRAESPMLDFEALGYSAQRRKELTSTPVVGTIQQIREGQPFNLPLAP